MVMITLYARQQRDTDVQNSLLDSVGEGEGGMIWENGIETCIISYMKWISSPGSMHDTGCLGLVQWDDPEGWYGEGNGRGVQDGEYVYTCVPHPEHPSHLLPYLLLLGQPRAPAQSILYHASNLDQWLISYYIIHDSMPLSQIIPPSPSPTESKRLVYTSVSLLLFHIQGYLYHLSKFHIYVLVYCIDVFLSGLLHSVQSAPVSCTSWELIQMYSF